jgi:hypothetical protein
VQPILVGGGQLVLQSFVQQFEDLRVALHDAPPIDWKRALRLVVAQAKQKIGGKLRKICD